jgi:hypothetical protein
MIAFAETDLHSSGFNFNWGQTRTWTNRGLQPMRTDSKDRLVEMIERCSAETLKQLACPLCSGPLNVQYTQRRRRALSVMCRLCRWKVVTDGLQYEPPWASDLGRKIETNPLLS